MILNDAARRFLLGPRLAHLVTLNDDGAPHVTVAWADVEGDELRIATLFDQRKLRNVRRDPRVAVSFEGERTLPSGLREHLVVHGSATVTEGGAPQLLQQLARRYLGPDVRFPPMPDPPPGYVTRVRIERVSGVGPWHDVEG